MFLTPFPSLLNESTAPQTFIDILAAEMLFLSTCRSFRLSEIGSQKSSKVPDDSKLPSRSNSMQRTWSLTKVAAISCACLSEVDNLVGMNCSLLCCKLQLLLLLLACCCLLISSLICEHRLLLPWSSTLNFKVLY